MDVTAISDEGFDVIGDVHGHVDKLHALLARLGYDERDGSWRHPHRRAVFVGDLIDRGPGQVETYRVARAMVDAGDALIVAGNHEYNAVAFHTPDPEHPGEFLRRHTEKNERQHAAFMAQVHAELHDEIVEWFRTLPLWLELDGLRIVHACWDPAAMDVVRPLVSETNGLTPELVEASARPHTAAWQAVEHLLKGPELDLPVPYLDPNDVPRTRARFRWWDPEADRLDRAVVLDGSARTPDGEPYPAPPAQPLAAVPVPLYRDPVPVVVGHYWRSGPPSVLTARVACVDYSAGRNGPLVAYRWSGEDVLTDDRFAASDG